MKAVSVRGTVGDVGVGKPDEIFEKNLYMNEIYPTRASGENCLHCGNCMEACSAGAAKYKEQ